MVIIDGLEMTNEDATAYQQCLQDAAYADRLQYVFKIKLNSLYGAMTNLYFRFYDLRMGESTTATGRAILLHQCRKVSELLDGKYDVDFPLYETEKECIKNGVDAKWALHGSYFNSEFQSESVVYGDSVAGNTIIETQRGPVQISSIFGYVDTMIGDKEYCKTLNAQS